MNRQILIPLNVASPTAHAVINSALIQHILTNSLIHPSDTVTLLSLIPHSQSHSADNRDNSVLDRVTRTAVYVMEKISSTASSFALPTTEQASNAQLESTTRILTSYAHRIQHHYFKDTHFKEPQVKVEFAGGTGKADVRDKMLDIVKHSNFDLVIMPRSHAKRHLILPNNDVVSVLTDIGLNVQTIAIMDDGTIL